MINIGVYFREMGQKGRAEVSSIMGLVVYSMEMEQFKCYQFRI
jgi:hypothetical protein